MRGAMRPPGRKRLGPGERSLLAVEPTPAASISLDELAATAKTFAEARAPLVRGARMGHHPGTRIIGVAEVRHGPLAVDGHEVPTDPRGDGVLGTHSAASAKAAERSRSSEPRSIRPTLPLAANGPDLLLTPNEERLEIGPELVVELGCPGLSPPRRH